MIGLSGMIVAVWAGLNERRRELAILRSVARARSMSSSFSPSRIPAHRFRRGLGIWASDPTFTSRRPLWMQGRFGVSCSGMAGGASEARAGGAGFRGGPAGGAVTGGARVPSFVGRWADTAFVR